MRDNDPAHYSEIEGIWVLTRFEDVTAAFKDWQTWSSQRRGNLIHDQPQRIGKTLGTTDPPKHTFARRLVNKAFTPRTVAKIEPKIRSLARDLSQAAREAGTSRFRQRDVRALTMRPSWGPCSACRRTISSNCATGWTISSCARKYRKARNRNRMWPCAICASYLADLADKRLKQGRR